MPGNFACGAKTRGHTCKRLTVNEHKMSDGESSRRPLDIVGAKNAVEYPGDTQGTFRGSYVASLLVQTVGSRYNRNRLVASKGVSQVLAGETSMRRWRLHGEQQWRKMGISFTL